MDITAEEVHLALSESTTVTELPSRIPTDTARYHLFRFDHTYEGDRFDSASEYYPKNNSKWGGDALVYIIIFEEYMYLHSLTSISFHNVNN